ncbi:hypothetical protein ACFQ46_02590 [Kineococcus sp. GCM10028916]|uniref:hypothetical protein n=1 Tax=Kineococcus sp. GCM10028916 TaxID=3273394 RepID=UPI00362B1AA1
MSLAAWRRAHAWHPPLMTVAALMGVCALVSAVGLVVDPREILGAPAWAKPLKFSLSILLYTVTWAWLIAHLPRWRSLTRALGTVIAVTLVVEQVLIVWAAATGTTSHFNVSNGLHATVWAVMAVSITVMYLATFVTSAAVFLVRFEDPALTLALRAGVLVALVGIGVAFLMTAPTSAQLSAPTGIIGAHAVGVPDGGPGLPLLGWSTNGGDFRVAHFVGIHALQVLPLLALLTRAAGRRLTGPDSPTTRWHLSLTAAVVHAATTVLLTVQAWRGQSVVHPAGVVLVLGCGLALAAVVTTTVLVVRRPHPALLPATRPARPAATPGPT